MFPQLEEEMRRLGREADRADKKLAEAMQALLKHPAWLAFQALLTRRIEEGGQALLAPVMNVDMTYASEHIKGVMFGLLLARDLPAHILTQMKPATSTEDDET